MYRIHRDLTDQWQRLCCGLESTADVQASIDRWRRECILLSDVEGLDTVRGLIQKSPEREQILCYLLDGAQHGDRIAHRTILQAFLPAMRSGSCSEQDACEMLGSAWQAVLEVPVHTPSNKCTFLGTRLRNARRATAGNLREDRSPKVEIVLVEALPERTQIPDLGAAADFEAMISDLSSMDQELMRLLFVEDCTTAVAAKRLGISKAAADKRRSRALAALRRRDDDDDARAAAVVATAAA